MQSTSFRRRGSAAHFTLEFLEDRRLLSVMPFKDVGQRLPIDFSLPTRGSGGLNVLPPPSPAPSGPIDPVAEYEPMEGLSISWAGTSAQKSMLAQIGRRVTVEANSRMYIAVTGTTAQNEATTMLNAQAANMSRVTFYTSAYDTIWSRDYGPRYIYEGDVRVITDHKYNRVRPNDDNLPYILGQQKGQKVYEMGLNGTQLTHGGGNYHLNATGDAYATRLISQENPSFTETQIQQIYDTYQNNDLTLTNRFPTNVDSTGHIDMWMLIYDDNKVFINDYPLASGSTWDVICDNTATLMASRGYQVTRLEARGSVGGIHYTFANMVICNNVVLLPQYNGGPGATVSNQVLAQVQAAFGASKTVYQINADGIVGSAGVFHCIVQHVPVHKGLSGANGGLAPTAYVLGPSSGQTFEAGDQFTINWISDDDAPLLTAGGVQDVDIELSTDGGQSWNLTIAADQPRMGSFNWTIPAGIDTNEARIRVVARDGVNNTGFDMSDANFTIDVPVANGTWTGNGDGLSWTDNFNWSNNVVPGALDDVIINVASSDPTITLTGTQSVKSLNTTEALHINGTLTIAGSQVVRAVTLGFGPTGSLDLRDNDLILDYTGSSTLADTQGQLNIHQISSSIADANPLNNTTLGAMESLDYRSIYGPSASFEGAPIDDSTVLVKYTYFGDTDFNGQVNFDDYARTDNGFSTAKTGWLNGDFDGNGSVNFDDYSLIDLAFNTQSGTL